MPHVVVLPVWLFTRCASPSSRVHGKYRGRFWGWNGALRVGEISFRTKIWSAFTGDRCTRWRSNAAILFRQKRCLNDNLICLTDLSLETKLSFKDPVGELGCSSWSRGACLKINPCALPGHLRCHRASPPCTLPGHLRCLAANPTIFYLCQNRGLNETCPTQGYIQWARPSFFLGRTSPGGAKNRQTEARPEERA